MLAVTQREWNRLQGENERLRDALAKIRDLDSGDGKHPSAEIADRALKAAVTP